MDIASLGCGMKFVLVLKIENLSLDSQESRVGF